MFPQFFPNIADKKLTQGFGHFPCIFFQKLCRDFTRATALAIGCDLSFVALPLLAAAASAIGTTRRNYDQSWLVCPINSLDRPNWRVWHSKISPMRVVMKPLQNRQRVKLLNFASEFAAYKQELRASRKAPRKDSDENVPDQARRCANAVLL